MRLDTKERRLRYRATMRPKYPVEIPLPSIDAVIYAKQDEAGRVFACCYAGSAASATWHHSFRNKDRFEEFVAAWQASVMEREEFRANRKALRNGGQHPFKVGSTLSAMWGYDQTNVDYFEVVAVRGKTVDLQEIGKQVVGSEAQTDVIVPTRRHRGKVWTGKRPQTSDGGRSWYIRVDSCRTATPWDGRMDRETAPGWGH